MKESISVIIATAASAKCDCTVSGDKDLID